MQGILKVATSQGHRSKVKVTKVKTSNFSLVSEKWLKVQVNVTGVKVKVTKVKVKSQGHRSRSEIKKCLFATYKQQETWKVMFARV